MKNQLRAEERACPFGGGEDRVQAGTRETQGSVGAPRAPSLPAPQEMWILVSLPVLDPTSRQLPSWNQPREMKKGTKATTAFPVRQVLTEEVSLHYCMEPGKQYGNAWGWADSQKSVPPKPRWTPKTGSVFACHFSKNRCLVVMSCQHCASPSARAQQLFTAGKAQGNKCTCGKPPLMIAAHLALTVLVAWSINWSIIYPCTQEADSSQLPAQHLHCAQGCLNPESTQRVSPSHLSPLIIT